MKDLSRRAEAVLAQQDELVWKHWVDGAPLEVGKSYEAAGDLFTPANIRAIERLRTLTRDPREVRALTYLHVHFVGEYLAAQLSDVTEAVANLESSMTISLEGKDVPYRDLERLLANEKTAERRRALWSAATEPGQRLSQSLKLKEAKASQLLRELGYPSEDAFAAELRQVELEGLGALAEETLQVTESAYLEVLKRLAPRELGMTADQLRRADITRLFRPRGVDSFFPREQTLPRAQATIAGLGFDLAALKNLNVDARELKTKNPRPLTLAVRVPGDIRVSLKPAGGVRDQASALHELGDALHFALSDEKRFELAKLGDSAVGDSFGSLFEDLLEDPIWLEEQAGLSGEKLAQDLAAASAWKLFQIRRAAARLVYELQLHHADPQDAQALYHTIFSRAYGVRFSAEDDARFQLDRGDFYPTADALRAWFLAGQLQGQLKARFGPSWWHSKAAGVFLRFLWARGNALTIPELARLAGEDGLKPDVLLLRLATHLKVPITLHATLKAREPAADAGAPFDAGAPPTVHRTGSMSVPFDAGTSLSTDAGTSAPTDSGTL